MMERVKKEIEEEQFQKQLELGNMETEQGIFETEKDKNILIVEESKVRDSKETNI